MENHNDLQLSFLFKEDFVQLTILLNFHQDFFVVMKVIVFI